MKLTKTMVEKFFNLEEKYFDMDDYLTNKIELSIKDTNISNIDDLEILFNKYDLSVDLIVNDDSWTPTQSVLNVLWELGFAKCWVKYKSGKETYYLKK